MGGIDISAIEDLNCVFSNGYKNFERRNFDGLETWDVSHVKNMGRTFSRAICFDHDISAWDVSNVTNTVGMFSID
ncbi:BspA family leucine-rich repeat surface protein [Helicobacter ailurogastricus]|uniref:BspA family leucine-rich repeat surface protein n=1 Tax=Helicobacter ailurogastricus TaxID=1578720 RepID=UPI002367EA91|nr:BspA family leucine-rich repeat surface protein [Helicobacter ailurogastricus]